VEKSGKIIKMKRKYEAILWKILKYEKMSKNDEKIEKCVKSYKKYQNRLKV